jgi:hypothetical protein
MVNIVEKETSYHEKREFSMPKGKQLSFADAYEKCVNLFEDQKPESIKLLEENLDISGFALPCFDFFYCSHFLTMSLFIPF